MFQGCWVSGGGGRWGPQRNQISLSLSLFSLSLLFSPSRPPFLSRFQVISPSLSLLLFVPHTLSVCFLFPPDLDLFRSPSLSIHPLPPSLSVMSRPTCCVTGAGSGLALHSNSPHKAPADRQTTISKGLRQSATTPPFPRQRPNSPPRHVTQQGVKAALHRSEESLTRQVFFRTLSSYVCTVHSDYKNQWLPI